MERQLIDQLSNHLWAVGAVTRVCYCKSPSSVWHQQMLKRYLLNGLMKFPLLSSLCLLDPTSSSQAYCSETKRLSYVTYHPENPLVIGPHFKDPNPQYHLQKLILICLVGSSPQN